MLVHLLVVAAFARYFFFVVGTFLLSQPLTIPFPNRCCTIRYLTLSAIGIIVAD